MATSLRICLFKQPLRCYSKNMFNNINKLLTGNNIHCIYGYRFSTSPPNTFFRSRSSSSNVVLNLSKLKLSKSVNERLTGQSIKYDFPNAIHLQTKRQYCQNTTTRPLQLMDIPELLWPHPIKTVKNIFFNYLISTFYDQQYSAKDFLSGSRQALLNVSNLISNGDFEGLVGLVKTDAISEIKEHYQHLSPEQRKFISVDTRDAFLYFVYEVGLIFDDSTKQQFVEVTTVLHGIHGSQGEIDATNPIQIVTNEELLNRNDYYICNYSFIRELTKGVEADWTISRLNHYLVKDLVKKTPLYKR